MDQRIKLDIPLETSPLQIKTDSLIGSDERIVIRLIFDDDTNSYSFFSIIFSSPPSYRFHKCMVEDSTVKYDWPPVNNKVWTIKKTTSAITILCNGGVVLYFALSENNCDSLQPIWKENVARIRFADTDSASDYYRIEPSKSI